MFIDSAQYLTELGNHKTQYSHVYRWYPISYWVLGFPSLVRYWALSINMAILGFRFSKLNKILGTIYRHGWTRF
jgi:hypothetical protein